MDPKSTAIVAAGSRSLLDVSFADPNRISTTFKVGEIWSVARDGSTGLDAKTKKKLWNKLKKEVIYRDTPEDLERKEREAEIAKTLAYRGTQEYKDRVAVDVAQARLKVQDKAKDLGLISGELDPDLAKAAKRSLDDDDNEDDDGPDDEETPDVPTRKDMFLAKVHTAQRVMAQLRPGVGVPTDMPKGLKTDVSAAAKVAVDSFLLTNPPTVKKDDTQRYHKRKSRYDDDDDGYDYDDDRDRRSRDRSRDRDRHRRRRRSEFS